MSPTHVLKCSLSPTWKVKTRPFSLDMPQGPPRRIPHQIQYSPHGLKVDAADDASYSSATSSSSTTLKGSTPAHSSNPSLFPSSTSSSNGGRSSRSSMSINVSAFLWKALILLSNRLLRSSIPVRSITVDFFESFLASRLKASLKPIIAHNITMD